MHTSKRSPRLDLRLLLVGSLVVVGAAGCAGTGAGGPGASEGGATSPTADSAGPGPVATPAAETAPADTASDAVCDVYLPGIEADPLVEQFERLDPAEAPAPAGVTLPVVPSCAARVEAAGTWQTYLMWDQGDFAATLDALENGGWEVLSMSDNADETSRSYWLTTPSRQSVITLSSGAGIVPGVSADGLLLVFGE